MNYTSNNGFHRFTVLGEFPSKKGTPTWDFKNMHLWHPTPVLLPGKSRGRSSLVRCSPWGCEESDTTEQLHFHFSLSCIGEGNGNPLQCSCQENPRDREAWWAAVYGVTQSRTQLKWLSSSSTVKFAIFLGTVLKMYKIEGVVELHNTTFKNWCDGMVKKMLHNVIYLLIDSFL